MGCSAAERGRGLRGPNGKRHEVDAYDQREQLDASEVRVGRSCPPVRPRRPGLQDVSVTVRPDGNMVYGSSGSKSDRITAQNRSRLSEVIPPELPKEVR